MNCPICDKETVTNSGYSESKILVVRSEPHLSEYGSYKSKRFYVPTTPLSVLRSEFFLLGVDFVTIRRANLWHHKPNKKSPECFQEGLNALLNDAKGKMGILLCGAAPVKYFTSYAVSAVSGLQVKSNQLSAPFIYASVDPSTALSKMGCGEIRFAITNFVKRLISEDVL